MLQNFGKVWFCNRTLVTLKNKNVGVVFFNTQPAELKKWFKKNFLILKLTIDSPTEEEIAVGTVLLRNLQLLQFNAHEIFETRVSNEHRFRGSKTVYLGVAIYPGVARFNHDCYPAVTR